MIKNVNIVKAKFKRSKKVFFKTDLYENFNKDIQQQINTDIAFLENEIPVLGYFISVNNYWLLTNFRLITNNSAILLDDIEVINIPEIFIDGKANAECKSLDIVRKNSDIYILELEELTWYVIFNVLNFIIRNN